MIVVLDSNVLFSAILAKHGLSARIHQAWRDKRFVLATCTEQIEEIRKSSRYPRFRAALQPYQFGILINNLTRARVWSEPLAKIYEAQDPTDSFLLNLAVAVKADYLVTSDKRSRILELKKVGATAILTPRQFSEEVLHL